MCLWTALQQGSVALLCAFPFVPELQGLGYSQSLDALSTLKVVGAFLLVSGCTELRQGVTLLLASIWIRPDNSVLALLRLAYLAIRG